MSKVTTNSLSSLQKRMSDLSSGCQTEMRSDGITERVFVSPLLLRLGCDSPQCLRLMPLDSNSILSKYFGTFKEQWDWIRLSSPGDLARKRRETTYRGTCLPNRIRYTNNVPGQRPHRVSPLPAANTMS